MTEAQQKKQNIVISKLIKGTFQTELGVKLLAHLERKFVDRDIHVQGLTLDQVAYRQGQADFVKQLLKEVAFGN